MSHADNAHAWWSRLRHFGMLLSPVVLVERYAGPPPAARFPLLETLRNAHNRFVSSVADLKENADRDEATILKWVDAVLEKYFEYGQGQIAKQHDVRINITAPVRIGSRTETLRPHRAIFTDQSGSKVALLVMADTSPHVGRGRGRTEYAKFLELLRGSGHRLGLLTNGSQFRLIYAGLDFEAWAEWESDRWFDNGEGTEELDGLLQLLSPKTIKDVTPGVPGLLDAVEESRKRQADLSSVLRENVRQAVELLLEDVSTAHRTKSDLFAPLVASGSERQLTDAEAHEALLQATVRVVMRMVVCLFAESRKLLPVRGDAPIYDQSYGVRSLYELLDEATRYEGGTHVLFNRQTAWPRLMALFRLIHGGSSHGAFALRAYGGVLFRPGDASSPDPVARALHILEHAISVGDATVYHVLRKLLRGPLPVVRGHQKTFVEGPVDYTDLRTEFIGLIYEGLLDYRLKRTDEQTGPQIFLNLGREPVLPLSRLRDMLENDRKGLKDLLTTLKKEKVTASVASEEEESDEETEEAEEAEEKAAEEPVVEVQPAADEIQRTGDYLDAVEAAKAWAREAVVLAGLIGKQLKKETDSQYQTRIQAEADRLINRVVAPGEFYLVRAGNTRKGTGTFYTRPQLAVPTVHRTLEPLCYDRLPSPTGRGAGGEGGEGQGEGGENQTTTLVPKTPEDILGLKVCDPACGSASFLVAALHYLTDALYKSLCHHRKLDDPKQAARLTLPYGRPRNGGNGDELLPFSPDDPKRGELFPDRVKALLRRHVVERCIYGVDINPLAVEFARVSLWVETLDPDLPFSFLDHKIKVGNSLVGCWLDRVEDYPLKAWERNGGDDPDSKTKGPRTQQIETLLKGEKIGNKRSGDGRIKKEMRAVIESRFSKQAQMFPEQHVTADQVVAEARSEYEKLHTLPIADPDERERFYREHLQASPVLRRLKQAMDEWCGVWFWPADEDSLQHVPTPLKFHRPSEQAANVIAQLAAEVKFLHWELEFPDVFTPQRSGFDAMIGNPPWDVMKPNSQEFFTDFDPLYRTYDKQAALRKQTELFDDVPWVANQWDDYNARFKALANWARNVAQPFDMVLVRGKEGEALAKLWEKHRSQFACYADTDHPYRLQGSADLNSYKMFTEAFWNLLTNGGRLGVILPTGVYSDLGTRDIRLALLFRGQLEFLYAFQNERRIFSAAHHAMKQSVVIASRGGKTVCFRTRFRMGVGDSPDAHEIPEDILHRDSAALSVTPDDLKLNSPKSLSLVELRSERDLSILRSISNQSIRLGENVPGWEIGYCREFDMTNDSKHFPPLEKWQARAFEPDPLGRWLGTDNKVALPFFEGRMIGQHDCSHKGWVRGKGRTAVWRVIPFDDKRFEPQFLMAMDTLSGWAKANTGIKVALMDITSSTNTRSMIAAATSFFPFGHSAPIVTVAGGEYPKTLFVAAVLNSLVFDYAARPRVGGVHFTWFILEECPIPKLNMGEALSAFHRVVAGTSRLTFLHRRFAPEWLKLKSLYPELASQEWKCWWAVTEADRLRLRVEIDALCADLYGLEPDDFDWIVRDDKTDPKGFYRVDRELPLRERLTGLAGAAFRALKEGKWSAESAPNLSNDEFFDILGIPELTNADTAKAKGLPGPSILKRDGCHVWKPENFPPDDPRHGWTWHDCWKDAVALLGSEEAVEKYIAEKPEKKAGTDDEDEGSFQLKADSPKARQKKMFQ
jgi:hypothetical protein